MPSSGPSRAGCAMQPDEESPCLQQRLYQIVRKSGGRRSSAGRLADLVLIPTRPSPHDLRAVGSTVDLVQSAAKPFIFAVTQAKPNARLTVQAVAALSEHGAVAPAIVHDRVDYAGSMIDGRTVQETDGKGRSAAEMGALWDFVKAQITKSTKARFKKKGSR